MSDIYYIGGSPCSGKSTIAEILSERYSLYYFKVDDHLDRYIKEGALKGYEICRKQNRMNAEQIWMRNPALQCREELLFYEEIFELVMEDIRRIEHSAIITEGAAYLPHLMKKLSVPDNRYLSITPSSDFQISHYSKREWVPFVLAECSDKELAFFNWMNRDVLFAQAIQRQCTENSYLSIINDGSTNIDELVERVAAHFGLDSRFRFSVGSVK